VNSEQLSVLLSESAFAETASYVPAATPLGAAVALTVRVRREQSRLEDRPAGRYQIETARVLCFATVDATYGGIVAPAVGDAWTLPRAKGLTGVTGWRAGTPSGHDGIWEIPLLRETRVVTDGARVGGAA
jgi:hypothetical protein